MDLVEVKGSEILCDSSMIAKKFGFKHNHVMKVIENLIKDVASIKGNFKCPLVVKEVRHYRGRDYEAYMLSREFFSLLCMRFKGQKALEWQMKFNAAFYEMESALLKQSENSQDDIWLKVRTQSKQLRLQQTDVIKEFVEYATNQGSKSAKFYYKHYTNATYKALGLIQHKRPKLKDTLDLMELSQLMVAENVAKLSIRKHMEAGEHYKSVFLLVKQDLLALSETLLIK